MDRPRIYRVRTMRKLLDNASDSTIKRMELRGDLPTRIRTAHSKSVFWDAAAVDEALAKMTKGGSIEDGKT